MLCSPEVIIVQLFHQSALGTISGVTRRGMGGHLPPGAAHWGRQIEVGMLRTKCQMSADANNCNLQNVECHWEISSRSLRFAKRAIMNLGDVSRRSFCRQ